MKKLGIRFDWITLGYLSKSHPYFLTKLQVDDGTFYNIYTGNNKLTGTNVRTLFNRPILIQTQFKIWMKNVILNWKKNCEVIKFYIFL